MQLLLSVHDVTPFHLERLKRCDQLLAVLGVTRVTYLVVPRFHGSSRIEEDGSFQAWVKAKRPFEAEWFLHGFYHDETTEPAHGPAPPGLNNWFRSRFMTAAEAEFLRLRGDHLQHRLERGCESFRRCFGSNPAGFVAPAWLFNNDLFPELEALRVRFTEDHKSIHDLQRRLTFDAPVITWASRTALRKYASLLAAPLLLSRWRARPVLRIAVHPYDFDHPMLIASIERVARSALSCRRSIFYSEAQSLTAAPR